MIRLMLAILLLLAVVGSRGDWMDHLILSSKACHMKAFDLALYHIDLALSKAPEMEVSNLKVQRGTYLDEKKQYVKQLWH